MNANTDANTDADIMVTTLALLILCTGENKPYMSLDGRKPVFRVSDQARLKLVTQLQRLGRKSKCFVFQVKCVQCVKNIGADQTVQKHRLVCTFVVRMQ